MSGAAYAGCSTIRILEPKGRNLTHENFSTLMTEVTAINNSRPITTIYSDPDMPFMLSPVILSNQKISEISLPV